jgi:hypothetical protein
MVSSTAATTAITIITTVISTVSGPVLMLPLHLVLRVSLLATAIVAVTYISNMPNTHRRAFRSRLDSA